MKIYYHFLDLFRCDNVFNYVSNFHVFLITDNMVEHENETQSMTTCLRTILEDIRRINESEAGKRKYSI